MEMTSRPWDVLERRHLYRNKWRSFVLDRVRLHTGSEIEYAYTELPDAVLVVPLTIDHRVVVVQQYRHPVGAWVWEVPAGSVGSDGPDAAARRELAEEVGGRCTRLQQAAWFYSAAPDLRQRIYVYLASGVTLGEQQLEDTELLRVCLLSPEEAFARAHSGAITDGQSALAILLCEPLIRCQLAQPGACVTGEGATPP